MRYSSFGYRGEVFTYTIRNSEHKESPPVDSPKYNEKLTKKKQKRVTMQYIPIAKASKDVSMT